MSGGSWDHLYSKMDDAADTLSQSKDPLRRAFGAKLKLFSLAMHDIEWVDSNDYGVGDEIKAIERALGDNSNKLVAVELVKEAKKLKESLETCIEKLELEA